MFFINIKYKIRKTPCKTGRTKSFIYDHIDIVLRCSVHEYFKYSVQIQNENKGLSVIEK